MNTPLLHQSSLHRALAETAILKTGAVGLQRGCPPLTHLHADAGVLGGRGQRRGVEEDEPPAVHGDEEGPEVGARRQEDDDAAAEVEVVERLEQPLQRVVQVGEPCRNNEMNRVS